MKEIQKLESFEYELAIAQTVEEVKILHSAAEAMAKFAKANQAATEAQNKIGRFIIKAAAKLGEVLDENFKQGKHKGNQYTIGKVEQDDLSKMPVSKDESSNTRLINNQAELREEVMEEIEDRGEVITVNKVQKEIRRKLKNEGVFVAATDKDILKKAKEIKEQKAAAYKQKIVERIENKVSQTEISQEEQDLIDKLSSGETIVININKHFHVLKEAKERGLYYQIDRYSSYGNPFFLDTDGNRDEVCDGYIEYFKHKRSLHNKVKELKGKALGCHCAPLRCHGDHLKSLADEN
jgi:hypothetical protein